MFIAEIKFEFILIYLEEYIIDIDDSCQARMKLFFRTLNGINNQGISEHRK
jgi:hypothetical protein